MGKEIKLDVPKLMEIREGYGSIFQIITDILEKFPDIEGYCEEIIKVKYLGVLDEISSNKISILEIAERLNLEKNTLDNDISKFLGVDEKSKMQYENNIENILYKEDSIFEKYYNDPVDELLTLLSSGTKGGIGAGADLRNALFNRCFIEQLENGRFRISGNVGDRVKVGITANGSTYKPGSSNFNQAGLNRYVPKGASISQITSKLYENAKTSAVGTYKNVKTNIATGEVGMCIGKSAKNFLGATYGISKNASGSYMNLGNVGVAAGYLGVGYNTVSGIKENIDNGESKSKVISDAVVDTGVGLGGMAFAAGCAKAGAAIGTLIPVPGVGTAVGAVLGFAFGYVGSKIYSSATGDISEKASSGLESIIDGAGEMFESAKNSVGDFFGNLGSLAVG